MRMDRKREWTDRRWTTFPSEEKTRSAEMAFETGVTASEGREVRAHRLRGRDENRQKERKGYPSTASSPVPLADCRNNRHSEDSASKSIDRRNHSQVSQTRDGVRVPLTRLSLLNSLIDLHFSLSFQPPGLESTTTELVNSGSRSRSEATKRLRP